MRARFLSALICASCVALGAGRALAQTAAPQPDTTSPRTRRLASRTSPTSSPARTRRLRITSRADEVDEDHAVAAGRPDSRREPADRRRRFQRPMANPTLAKTAEARGFIVAAVTGIHANATGCGRWNVPYPMVQVPQSSTAGWCAHRPQQGRAARTGPHRPRRNRTSRAPSRTCSTCAT
jgi:hypothetical protein